MADQITGQDVDIITPLGSRSSATAVSVVIASDQLAIPINTIVPGTGATNLGKAQAGAYAASDVGVAAMAVVRAGGTALSGTGNTYGPVMMDTLNHLWISGSHVDNTAFTNATHSVTIMGAQFDDTSTNAATENAAAVLRMSSRKELYVQLRDAAGNERGVNINASNQLSVSVDNAPTVVGNVAHDGVDSGAPVKVGLRAIAHGTNPTAVSAADRTDWFANRAGVPFVMGGHPNIVTIEAAYTAAQTDTAIVTVAGGLVIVVTEVEALCDNANTVNVGVRVGFGTANTPTTTGVVLTHPGIAPGSGVIRGNGSGILGVGADGADLRVTCTVPTTGSVRVLVSYFTCES